MLDGLDPILLFNFSKLNPLTQSFVKNKTLGGLIADVVNKIDLPAIPLYLSESLTGLYIMTEDKSIEIQTDVENPILNEDPIKNQRALNNTIKITMQATKDSVGLPLLTALCDFIFPKISSQEYSITYLHGPITVFGGLLHSFNVQQNSNNTLYEVSLELVKIGIKQKVPLTQIDAKPGVVLTPGKAVGT